MSNIVTYDIKSDFDKTKNILIPYFLPFNGLITCNGLENIIKDGPNIIIINHPGVGKDIALLLKVYERQLFFTASDFVFSKETILNKFKGYCGNKYGGRFKYDILKPLANSFSDFLPSKMKKYEMIPISLKSDLSREQVVQSLKKSIDMAKDYLKKERAIVFFQMNTDISKKYSKEYAVSKYHNYLFKFHNTVSRIIHELYKGGLYIPITPVAFYGGEGINPFRKIVMNIGEPVYLESIKENNSIPEFTNILEQKVANLLIDVGISRDIMK